MRTESQMLDLVRDKLGRRRRRRRAAAASAGGGAAAVLLVVVVLVGGSGRHDAVDDVKTGPGGSSTTTTTAPELVGGPEEGPSTTTAPAEAAPDAGAGASGAAPNDDPGTGGGPSTVVPDGSSSTEPPGSDTGTPDSFGGASGPGPGPGTSTPTPTTAPVAEQPPPPEPHIVEGAASHPTQGLTLSVRAVSDPEEPGAVAIRIRAEDPTGTSVQDGARQGLTILFRVGDGPPFVFGDPEPTCDGAGPYVVEPAHYDDTIDLMMSSGAEQEIHVVAKDMTCHAEAAEVGVSMVVRAS